VAESEELIGHGSVVQFFKNSLDLDRLCSTYLFSGPSGIGKRVLCRYLAKFILCKDRQDVKSCGKCSSCTAFHGEQNPYFQERYFIQEKSRDESAVDVARSFIRDIERVHSSNQTSIFLLPNFENYSMEVQNALLKTLEEPPSGIVIFLTTDHPKRVLETIHSRSQTLHLSPLSTLEMKRSLSAKLDNPDALDSLVRISEGSMEKAMKYATSAYQSLLIWVEKILQKPSPDFLTLAEEAKTLAKDLAEGNEGELSDRKLMEEWVKVFEKMYFEKALNKVKHHFVAMQVLNTTMDDLLNARRSIVLHGHLNLSVENYLQIAISRWMQMTRFVRIPEED
jgi:DNA polymerase III delta prime subunit